jgi:hypothetical protein
MTKLALWVVVGWVTSGEILTPEWVFHSWLHHFSGEANTTKKIRNSAFLIVLESDKLLGY